jgi:integral membrane protein (TIGR00529 family)
MKGDLRKIGNSRKGKVFVIELFKIGFIFFAIITLTFLKVNLWISLLGTTFLFGLLFHLPVVKIGADLVSATLDEKTLLLIAALFAILFFSNLLKETGRMNKILEGFRHILKDIRVVIALLPAMIGLMPLVGGALVSAPMVVEGSDQLRLSPERRTFINYWFRHVWEYILPTYPALILAATLVGVPVRKLGWVNLPLTPVAILSGAMIGFWGISNSKEGGEVPQRASVWELLKNLFPLIFALVLVLGFKVELAYAFGLTILGMVLFNRLDPRTILKALKGSLSIELLLTVVTVMGFKKVLESSQAILTISTFLSSSGVPFRLIAIFVPLIVGLMTGMTIAPIAIGFPILIPLFQNDPDFLNYMMLAFASGIAGDLLSPFHLCLVLTKDYFHAEWKGIFRLLWVPVASLLGVALLMTYIR